jgi:hypothetical protein
VTSTLADSLPDRTIRVTPHNVGLMATVRISGNYGMYFAGNATPAAHIKLRGLHILNAGASQTVSIGNMNTRDGYTVTGYDQQPKGIWLEQCVIRAESMFDTSTQHVIVSVDGRVYPSGLIGNWIAFAWHKISAGYFGNETQLVYVHPSSTGSVQMVNNYIADCSGENIMLGGTGPPYDPVQAPLPNRAVHQHGVMNHRGGCGKRLRGGADCKVFKAGDRRVREVDGAEQRDGRDSADVVRHGGCSDGQDHLEAVLYRGRNLHQITVESKTGSGLPYNGSASWDRTGGIRVCGLRTVDQRQREVHLEASPSGQVASRNLGDLGGRQLCRTCGQ